MLSTPPPSPGPSRSPPPGAAKPGSVTRAIAALGLASFASQALVRAADPPPSIVVLSITATADLDVATIDMFSELIEELQRRSIELRLAQARGAVRDRMRRTGLMEAIGEERVFLSVSTAVEDATPHLAGPAARGPAEPISTVEPPDDAVD